MMGVEAGQRGASNVRPSALTRAPEPMQGPPIGGVLFDYISWLYANCLVGAVIFVVVGVSASKVFVKVEQAALVEGPSAISALRDPKCALAQVRRPPSFLLPAPLLPAHRAH